MSAGCQTKPFISEIPSLANIMGKSKNIIYTLCILLLLLLLLLVIPSKKEEIQPLF